MEFIVRIHIGASKQEALMSKRPHRSPERKTQSALYQTYSSLRLRRPKFPTSPWDSATLSGPFLSVPLSPPLLLPIGFLHFLLTFHILTHGPPRPHSSSTPATHYLIDQMLTNTTSNSHGLRQCKQRPFCLCFPCGSSEQLFLLVSTFLTEL